MAMLERTQVDLEAKDKYGRTPLLWTAENGHLDAMQCLCEQGADKEARGAGGMTALQWAADMGRLDMVQYLCELGAWGRATISHGIT